MDTCVFGVHARGLRLLGLATVGGAAEDDSCVLGGVGLQEAAVLGGSAGGDEGELSGALGGFDGVGAGVDARGALQVRMVDGSVRLVDSADVTVRRA